MHYRTNPEFDTYASRQAARLPNSSINLHRNMARLTLLLVAIVAAMATAFVPASNHLARSGKLYSSVVAWTSFHIVSRDVWLRDMLPSIVEWC